MIPRAEMSYSQIVRAKAAEDEPSFFMCGVKSLYIRKVLWNLIQELLSW